MHLTSSPTQSSSANAFTNLSEYFPANLDDIFLYEPDGCKYSYADMIDASGRLAQVLINQGVGPTDRVAVYVEKSPQALFLYLATLRAGAAFLPLNTAYTVSELNYFLGDAQPAVLVCAPNKLQEISDIATKNGVKRILTLDTNGEGSLTEYANDAEPIDKDVKRGGDDLAAILYTSGTTGRSKGAMLTHYNLTSNALALRDTWHFTSNDCLLHALPIFHTHGLFVATNVILACAGSMIFLPKFDIDQLIRSLPQATTMMGVPTFYTRLLTRADFTRELVSHIRLFISGSAPLSVQTHRTFEQRTGHAILERYGMTETGMNTSNPDDGERRAGTVGFPLPDVNIRITERETGAVLPDGEVGIIEISGPNVFKGYWRMPEKTVQEFREGGFFISGDLGFIDEQGYLQIVGRDKDLIISGGFNIYPKEIETALERIPGIAESAIIGVPHPDFGEGVTAVVTLDSDSKLTEDSIKQQLATVLAGYKLPKKVLFEKELPRNAMGKIQKKVLREKYADIYHE